MTSGVILPAHVQKRGSFCIICKDGEAAEQESWEEEVAEDRDGEGVDARPGEMDVHRVDIDVSQMEIDVEEEEIARSRIYFVGGRTCFRGRACESPNGCGRVFCDCTGWGGEALSARHREQLSSPSTTPPLRVVAAKCGVRFARAAKIS